MIVGSNLEHVLTSGQFAVTGELGPPKNGDPEVIRKKAKLLKGYVDAVNITDCQTAIVRMSSLTAGLIALSEGLEPVLQMTCRDRNRIGMQADLLGASALGIKNLLCLTGDHQKFGNHPQAKGVFDMDSIQLLTMAKALRDDKKFQCGEEIKGREPRFFLGCAANPFADPFEFRPIRLAKKVEAGANFVQTQIIYNVKKFEKFMEMVRDLGLHEKVYILAGVTPPKSVGMAKYMKRFVPGLDVPDEIIERLQSASDVKEEGIQICVDIINQVREIEGVAGVHIMAIEWEQAVAEIVKRAGLDKRPEPKGIEPVLISTAEIEARVERVRAEVEEEMKKQVERAQQEAKASRDLVAKAKEQAEEEISRIKKELDTLKEDLSKKDKETLDLRSRVEDLKKELSKKEKELKEAKKKAASLKVVTPSTEPTPTAQPVTQQPTQMVTGVGLTPREQYILNTITAGMESFRKALGLGEDQFDAIKRFLEVQFMLHFGAMPSTAGVQPEAMVQPSPAPSVEQVETPSIPEPEQPDEVEEIKEEAKAEPKEEEEKEEALTPSEDPTLKKVIRLTAKGNVLIHKKDYKGALEAFKQALELKPGYEKALKGLEEVKKLAGDEVGEVEAPKEEVKEEAKTIEGIPPCPPEVSEDEWRIKYAIRFVAKGNLALYKGDFDKAKEFFKKALELDPQSDKAKEGLKKAENNEKLDFGGAAPSSAPSVEPKEAPKAEEEKVAKLEAKLEAKEEVKAEPEKEPQKAVEEKVVELKKPKEAVKKSVSTPIEGIGSLETPELPKEERSLKDRVGDVIPEDTYMEPCTAKIQEVTLGTGDKAITVGGESTLPFHVFEGEVPNPPAIFYEILDIEPEEWPDPLVKYYKDVWSDPASWAKKCVEEYGAKGICLSLISTDPNGMNRDASEAAKVAEAVANAVDVPIILWGCGNAEKDTETLREVINLVGDKRTCIGPLTDANYKALGATAMAFQLPVVASTPIDVNLAKQLNILLENLGVHMNQILMDPSIGALGYGLEYTYSVMERIRLAALTQQDDKLQPPFICNLGREVWKAKECRLPSDEMLGDQERRSVMMEAMTALVLALAGGEVFIMRHPKAVSMMEALIKSLL